MRRPRRALPARKDTQSFAIFALGRREILRSSDSSRFPADVRRPAHGPGIRPAWRSTRRRHGPRSRCADVLCGLRSRCLLLKLTGLSPLVLPVRRGPENSRMSGKSGPVGPMPETGGRCGGRMPRPRFPSFWGRRLPERLFRRFGERKTFLSSIYPHIIISFPFRFSASPALRKRCRELAPPGGAAVRRPKGRCLSADGAGLSAKSSGEPDGSGAGAKGSGILFDAAGQQPDVRRGVDAKASGRCGYEHRLARMDRQPFAAVGRERS